MMMDNPIKYQLNYVSQPEKSWLCGQACVAMLADITLTKSIAIFGKRSGTTTKDVIKALRSLGVNCGDKLISLKKQSKSPVCMVVLHDNTKNTHWTVYCNGLYYDPAAGIGNVYPEIVRETSFLPIYNAKVYEVQQEVQ